MSSNTQRKARDARFIRNLHVRRKNVLGRNTQTNQLSRGGTKCYETGFVGCSVGKNTLMFAATRIVEQRQTRAPAAMRKHIRPLTLLLRVLLLGNGLQALTAAGAPAPGDVPRGRFVTNAAQLWTVSPEDFLTGCAFRLKGTVTLVDTNRNFMVLQDETGAVGIDYPLRGLNLESGDWVSVESSNCSPALTIFPDYPHRPSGWQIRRSFEAPNNWGEYHLTRMRGFLHPPASGQYTFWIASDNSSELWLSTDVERSKMRKIASVARYEWTLVHEWTKFPSQRSEKIWLNAGQAYYIEALQEQTGGGDNLGVAWQGPDVNRSVIGADYLTPWNGGSYAGAFQSTNGILHEYWTNFSAGDLSGIGGPRPFQAALSVAELRVLERREKQPMPAPYRITSTQPWKIQNNYRWAEVEGTVKFASELGDTIFVQLTDGKSMVQVRTPMPRAAASHLARDVLVRIQGVCEATYDDTAALTPGLIWVTSEKGISVIDAANTNTTVDSTNAPAQSVQNSTPSAMAGFYAMRAVVTFSGRVFDKDCLFVQEGNAGMFVSLENFAYHNPLKVGQLLDLGGALRTDKSLPIITPLVFTEIGWRALPAANTDPIQVPLAGDRDGKWTELQGVVHGVNSNGTITVMGPGESVSVWLGQTRSNELSRYIDAKLRLWGVLSLSTFPSPMLLVPSRSFVEVDEPAAPDAFSSPVRSVADLKLETADPSLLHRVKVIGEVTLQDAEWFFVQDGTGGIRVQTTAGSPVKIGQPVEVVGFPITRGLTRILSDAAVRTSASFSGVKPSRLDLTEGLPVRQNGSLIQAEATLLKATTIGNSQIVELQREGRVFTSTLLAEHGRLAKVAPGSQIEITGVCDTESTALPLGTTAKEKAALASLNIWLRSPGDLKVLSGPPWWTWKRTALLISTLSTIMAAALLWVYFLRRRLQKQKALQLAFSQQVLKRLEDERRRIAANLHDGLGQVLLAIRNQALLAMQRSPQENGVRQRLEEISGATSQALDEVRQITHGLRPYQLNRLGLTQAIRAILNQVSSDSQIVFANRVDDMDHVFDEDSEIHVYRIVQEAINNVIKHSAATEAAVVIKNRTQIVSLSIRDNGKGFDPASTSASDPSALGYGLSGIAERVRILGGTLTVDSRPGRGTNLTIEIPVTDRKK
jgi:signal transduction histidine kinase